MRFGVTHGCSAASVLLAGTVCFVPKTLLAAWPGIRKGGAQNHAVWRLSIPLAS